MIDLRSTGYCDTIWKYHVVPISLLWTHCSAGEEESNRKKMVPMPRESILEQLYTIPLVNLGTTWQEWVPICLSCRSAQRERRLPLWIMGGLRVHVSNKTHPSVNRRSSSSVWYYTWIGTSSDTQVRLKDTGLEEQELMRGPGSSPKSRERVHTKNMTVRVRHC